MKKIDLPGFDTTLYFEKLPNGLEVYLLPHQDKSNYYMTYATHYGSLEVEFVPFGEKKMIKVPNGIAHFLEHKMFEQESGEDPFVFFGKSGTMANASTDYDVTQYLCSGNKDLKENLLYLLDYVENPYFTDENVAKEKGIITQEIAMYDDMPEWVLEDLIRANIFHYFPMKDDIAGTKETVEAITKEDLYHCYHTFYRPDNMFFIATGKFDPEEVMSLIKEHQQKRTVKDKNYVPKLKDYQEPETVLKKETIAYLSVKIPKIAYAIKLDRKKMSIDNEYIIDCYLQMIMTLLFGTTSLFKEEARQSGLLNRLHYAVERADHYRTMLFVGESDHPVECLKAIKEQLENVTFSEEDVERIKRVWISGEVQMIDDITTTADNLLFDIAKYGHILPDKIALLRSLNSKDLNKFVKELNFKNDTKVIIYPKDKKDN